MKKLRAVIIGCGSVAGGVDDPVSPHALSHAKGILANSEIVLAGCFDVVAERAEAFKGRWGVERIYTSVDAALSEQIDIAIIASPTTSHAEILKRALISPAQFVVCEKPLVATSEEFNEIAPQIRGTTKKVIVNFLRRFDRSHQELIASVKSGSIGKPLYFHADVGKGLLHNGSHLVDLLVWLFGEVTEIKPANYLCRDGDLFGLFAVQHKEGICGSVQTTGGVTYSLFDLTIVCERGQVRVSDIGYDISILSPVPSPLYRGYSKLMTSRTLEPTLSQAFANLYREIVLDSREWGTLCSEALHTTEVILNCKKAYYRGDDHART